MRILAIDTSCGAASVAVVESGRDRAAWRSSAASMARGHAEALAPMVEEAALGVEGGFATLDRIAVTTGPGSFTGIRVGLAMARAMGLALGVPVVGVSTLAAFAAPLLSEPRPGVIAAAIDARHGSVYFQLFEASGRPLGPPRCDALRECVRGIGAGPALLAGDAAALVATEAHRAGLPYDLGAAARRARHRRGRAHGPCPRSRRPTPPARSTSSRPTLVRTRPSRSRGRPRNSKVSMVFGLGRSPPPVIRPLRPDKAADCARLHAADFAHPWSADEMASLIARSTTLAAAALDPASGRLRGFVLSRLAADEAEILTIAVEPALARQGRRASVARREPAPGRERRARKTMFLEVDEAQCVGASRSTRDSASSRSANGSAIIGARTVRGRPPSSCARVIAMSALAASSVRSSRLARGDDRSARLSCPRACRRSLRLSVRRGGSRRDAAGASGAGRRCCFIACSARVSASGCGGTAHSSGGANQLIVANHVSWLDIPVLGSLEPMSFLAKKEVGDHPLGRELVAMQGVVYVDRRRRSCIPAVNARMAETMRAGSPVVLFAEATTGDGNRLLRFRSSHFEAVRQAAVGADDEAAVIQPVYLDYSRLAGLPMARGERPRVAWYGDMTFLRAFLPIRPGRRRDLRRLCRSADPRLRRTWTGNPPPGSTEAAVRRSRRRGAGEAGDGYFPGAGKGLHRS